MSTSTTGYYLPGPSYWPITGSLALFLIMLGAGNWLHGEWFGPVLFFAGFLLLFYMMFGWFGEVIHENLSGLYNAQVDRSYRWSMGWFIFTEVMFFGAFFGTLLYLRVYTVPHLGGQYASPLSHYLLWPDFKNIWPVIINPDNYQFLGAKQAMPAWGVPAINTLILLSSGVTVTWAHWGLKKAKRQHLIWGLVFTVLLGMTFLYLQAHEYAEAYHAMGLKLNAGVYGSTFFMLTGFHGAHVTIGTIMLIVILLRSLAGHFSEHNHFAFEAVSWYWHFVDVVWLFLFIFVYWL